VLVADGATVRFRHELAREVVHDALLPDQRQRLHRRVLAALEHPPAGRVDHARATHHAVEAGATEAVLRHAPLAAGAAEAAEARREAVAHLELALAHADRLAAPEQIELWSRLAEQQSLLGDHRKAIEAYEQAAALAERGGDGPRRGLLLARLWTPLSMSGEIDRAGRAADEAIAVLRRHGPGPGLALAYAQRCSQHMLARELTDAEPWGRAAIELAAYNGDDEVLAYALIQSGVALWMAGDQAGLGRLHRGVAIARARGNARLLVHGLSQIGAGGGEVHQYAEAVPALEECVAIAERHELGSRGLYAAAWLARCRLALGHWDEAGASLAMLAASPRCEGITRLTVLTDLGRLRARRGEPDVWGPLDEALVLARRTGHLQRLWPVAAARAEAAWLAGRLVDEVDDLRAVHATACHLAYPWAVGELGLWLRRAGARAGIRAGIDPDADSNADPDADSDVEPDIDSGVEAKIEAGVEMAAAPYALHLAGDPSAAATRWAGLGCVYEQAAALADSADDADQRAALALFERLGAKPAASRLIERRRAAGRRVPRGPNAATRENPGGLTDRETDVLRLVAAGCSNREIAVNLHISVKTVGHHVSHVLTKLRARSRAGAVAAALGAGVRLAP
jgi:DNA-binding CsgD family transcriptional regulator/tetratricopeptide (TPR) repeat protein